MRAALCDCGPRARPRAGGEANVIVANVSQVFRVVAQGQGDLCVGLGSVRRVVRPAGVRKSARRFLRRGVALFPTRWKSERGGRVSPRRYVLRANDDVYLRLKPTARALFGAGPPARVYGGLFLDGSVMTVPRREWR